MVNAKNNQPVYFFIVIIDVFDYQGAKWGYYLTTKYHYNIYIYSHPTPPAEFYAQPPGETQWYTYKTLTKSKDEKYYQCVETNEYIYNDPRGGDYFACPIASYQIEPQAEEEKPVVSMKDDDPTEKKIKLLETEVKIYKQEIEEDSIYIFILLFKQ